MDQAQFSQEMAHRGCVADPDGKTFCGTYEGFPFAAAFTKGSTNGPTVFTFRFMFDRNVKNKFYKTLRKQMRGIATVAQNVNYNYLWGGAVGAALATASTTSPAMLNLNVVLNKNQPFDAAFDGLSAMVVQYARAEGYGIPQNCPVCKQPGCDAYAYSRDGYVPVHAACVQQQAAQSYAAVQDNEVNGSYGLGVLGAILGSVVGAIPTILIVIFFSRIVGILCALIPLGAFYGYKLLRGKMTKAVLPIIIAVSLLMVPAIYYITQACWILVEDGYFIPPMEFIAIALYVPGEVIADMLIYFLFTILGIIIVSSTISRNNRHTWNEASFAAATLRPMPGVTQQPYMAAPAVAAAPAVPGAPNIAQTPPTGMP